MDVPTEAPGASTPPPLKPFVDPSTGQSFATKKARDEAAETLTKMSTPVAFADDKQDASMEDTQTVSASASAAPEELSSNPEDPSSVVLEDVHADEDDVEDAIQLDEPCPRPETDDDAAPANDQTLTCPRCSEFTCAQEINLEAHLRQCRRREVGDHVDVVYPSTTLFPTPEELKEQESQPTTNEGLSTIVKASKIATNPVAPHSIVAGPSHQPATAPMRRGGRPAKESAMPISRGGKLNVSSPSGLHFAIRRDARSKRFKCPRCNVWAHGNPVNFHEHVQNECTEPWPTVVPASAEVRGPGRPRKSAAAAREEEEEEEEDEEAGDEEGAAAGEAAANGEEKDADMADETAEKSVAGALCAEGETSEPKDEGAGGAADSQAGEAAVAPADGPLPGTIPGGGRRQREVPRRESTRSLRAKPVKVMKEWGSDDEDDAFMMSGEDAPYEEDSDDDDDHVPVSQVRRKKRASTANSDGTRSGQHVLAEGEESAWQVTCRICEPALAFTNQSVKKVHHRIFHQTMCTIGAVEPGHTIKVFRTGDAFICPKCEGFTNRDPVSLQTHAKNCRAVYTGPTDPPPVPTPEGEKVPKKRGRKSVKLEPLPPQYDAEGNLIPQPERPEGLGPEGSLVPLEPNANGKTWICNRCDPPLHMKNESERAMHYRKTHQKETSITDPAGIVHIIQRNDDGFFRCIRCPGYTSRDSVLARTHILKSCRYPWPMTPGQEVDPNTVEVPSAQASPRETKRRKKDPAGPSKLGNPNEAGPSTATSQAAGSVEPIAYQSGPSSYAASIDAAAGAAYAPVPGPNGTYSAESYSSAAAAHDPYASQGGQPAPVHPGYPQAYPHHQPMGSYAAAAYAADYPHAAGQYSQHPQYHHPQAAYAQDSDVGYHQPAAPVDSYGAPGQEAYGAGYPQAQAAHDPNGHNQYAQQGAPTSDANNQYAQPEASAGASQEGAHASTSQYAAQQQSQQQPQQQSTPDPSQGQSQQQQAYSGTATPTGADGLSSLRGLATADEQAAFAKLLSDNQSLLTSAQQQWRA